MPAWDTCTAAGSDDGFPCLAYSLYAVHPLCNTVSVLEMVLGRYAIQIHLLTYLCCSESSAQAKSVVAASHNGVVAVESELRDLREAVSNVTREAEFLKRQLDEAFAYIRQLEDQQASVMSDLATANSAAAAAASVQTPSVGAI